MAIGFQDLDIWKKGFSLLIEIADISQKFPKEERYALKSQINRSANSIISNIAESHGRYYFGDKVRVLYISRGEIEETRSHLKVCLAKRYINQEVFNKFDSEYEGLLKGVNSYISCLIKGKNQIS